MDFYLMAGIGLLLLVLLLVLIGILVVLRRRRSAAKSADQPQAAKKPSSNKKKDGKRAPVRRVGKKEGKSGGKIAPEPEADSSNRILGSPSPTGAIMPAAQAKEAFAPAGEKIRILIVDDNTGTRENVSRLLYFENDLEVIGQAVNGRQGVEMTIELKPHIVLMDINMPDMDGITATSEMAKKAPFSQVIIMSVQADQHYMKRAMAAGARDFQPKPFTSDELVSCIRRVYNIGRPAYQQFEAMEKSKTAPKHESKQTSAAAEVDTPLIAVFSPKGGVGTSALAANLAVSIQRERGDTVLLDGSFQFGDISVHLNTRPTRTVSDGIHDGQLEEDLLADIVLAHSSGLKLLLAPSRPELAETITGPIVYDILAGLKNRFNAVVIDTYSKLNATTLTILDAADVIVLVMTPELTAVKSAKLFLELSEDLEFASKQIFVVMNRIGIPNGVQLEQVQKILKMEQVYGVPHDSKLYFSLNRGSPVCLDEPSAPSSQAIAKLVQAIQQALSQTELEEEVA